VSSARVELELTFRSFLKSVLFATDVDTNSMALATVVKG